MKIARYVGVALMLSLCVLDAQTPSSRFDGTWQRTWSTTTPKGLHTEGRGTLTINTRGRSTEVYDVALSLRRPNPPAPLHIVQSSEGTSANRGERSVTIRWSPRKLVSPAPAQIPPTLHLFREPLTRTYTVRANKLVSLEDASLVYTKAKR